MSDSTLISLGGLALGLYLLWIWIQDFRQFDPAAGKPPDRAIAGATPASIASCAVAFAGAALIVLLVTGIEIGAGVFDKQSRIEAVFLGAMIGAAITEEIIFRGYLVIRRRGKALLAASMVGFSACFAIIHPYLWRHCVEDPSGLQWIMALRLDVSTHSLLATGSIFVLSLWFYAVRFAPNNPHRSLLPCFCAHLGANATVYIIKLSTGFVI